MLKIENVYKNFGTTEVLKGLNLAVQEGSVFGLVGVNGAGKSTLLRLISGVYEADQGTVSFNDHDTFRDPNIRQSISFVSDEPYYPIGATITSMKNFYASLYQFDEASFRKYCEIFGLNPSMRILNLSKGMKRRAALLFALCTHPKLLLLDEAYDGLEPIARLHFKQILADLVEDEKLTVIISSHNLRELEDICDSYGILEDGVMLTYGDLIASRENINKYQAAFAGNVPADVFKDLDVLHLEIEGRVVKAVIRGSQSEVQKKIEALKPVLIDVLPVSFEELFIYEVEKKGEHHE
ncbi:MULTISPECIES: ABC transporter ATP-binding protein [Erysipelotrichaceae]|nr:MULTISPECIES: ABC transporter ATP-binding protein [Erysipelotrichaceae]